MTLSTVVGQNGEGARIGQQQSLTTIGVAQNTVFDSGFNRFGSCIREGADVIGACVGFDLLR